VEPAKTRIWTEEETKLLVELAQRKERIPAMARELGRHIASVKRPARDWVCFCRAAELRGSFSFSDAVETLPGAFLVNGAAQTNDAVLVTTFAERNG
jgi:hypothetical protein